LIALSGISQQQVEKLQTQISKVKGPISRSDNVKIAELQRSLDQSRQKEKSEAEKWTSKYFSLQHENTSLLHEYASLQRDKKQIESEWTKAKATIASTKKEVAALQGSEWDLLRQLAEERECRRKAEESLAGIKVSLEEQSNNYRSMQDEQSSLTLSLAEQQEDIEAGRDLLTEQTGQRIALERVAMDRAQMVEKLMGERRDMILSRSIDKAQVKRQTARIECLEVELRHSRAIIADLKEEVQHERMQCEEAWLQINVALSRQESKVDCDQSEADNTGLSFVAEEELEVLSKSTDALRIAGDLALLEERERADELINDITELQAKLLGALQQVGAVNETQRMLDEVREELESVEEAYEKGLLEAMRAHKGEEEAKRNLSSCKADNEILAEKLRQMEKNAQKLVHAKMKEEAWLQEREKLLQDLESSRRFETEYGQLRDQTQLLLLKSTLYQEQLDELTNLNTILASHTNPSQKIFYLDRIRKELEEKRNECQLLAVERDQFKAVSKDLQVKLDLFCKVESRLEDRPKTAYRRVARQTSHHNFSTAMNNSTKVLTERSSNKPSSPVKARKKNNRDSVNFGEIMTAM
jgi:chromosome segregation ATPase